MSTRAKNGNHKLIGIPVPLPGMEHVEEERAATRAEELQAQLTAELLKPKGNIGNTRRERDSFATVPGQRSQPTGRDVSPQI